MTSVIPLENKALTGQYPPGSTFKVITALAGLENGMINETTSVNCSGSYESGHLHLQMLEQAWTRHDQPEKIAAGIV